MAGKAATEMVPVRTGLSIADPFFRTFQERMNRLFSENLASLGANLGSWMEPLMEESWSIKAWAPRCDIYETDNEIVVKAELPDVKLENIHVGVENNMLTIRGERKFEEETKRENYHRVERSYGEFSRSFSLPNFADPGRINAQYKDGILRVTIAKKEEVKPKQVEIKVA